MVLDRFARLPWALPRLKVNPANGQSLHNKQNLPIPAIQATTPVSKDSGDTVGFSDYEA